MRPIGIVNLEKKKKKNVNKIDRSAFLSEIYQVFYEAIFLVNITGQDD